MTGSDILALLPSGGLKPREIVKTSYGDRHASVSPGGRWLAYTSDESGRSEVFVQSFPGPGGRMQISTNGGTEPVWARDGRELFYLSGDAMMVVEVQTAPRFSIGTPRILFRGEYVVSPNAVASYDVTSDGKRFLRVQSMHLDPPTDQIQIVVNWFEELKRLVPTN
jgi:Tol biopolymer transport system component